MDAKGYNWKPYVAMVCLQFGFAGMTLVSKVSLDRGLSHFVLVVYRQAFATLATAPLALLLERKVRPTITLPIFLHMFALGLLGPVIDQNLYYAGLKNTTPKIASAITNFLPAITFLMAILFRMEKVEIRKMRGQAKVIGMIVIVVGALVIILLSNGGSYGVRSVLLILASTLAWAAFFNLQMVTLRKFPAPLSLAAVVCGLGMLQSTAVAFAMESSSSVWTIGFDINLFTVAYAGILTSGIAYYVHGRVGEIAGPVFVTAFNPLATIVVTVLACFIIGDRIYLVGVIGATLLVIGVCIVLFGKHKDMIKCEIISESIKGPNHVCGLPTILEDVEANTYFDVEKMSYKYDSDALTRIVVVPIGDQTFRLGFAVEAPKMQSSFRIVYQERGGSMRK